MKTSPKPFLIIVVFLVCSKNVNAQIEKLSLLSGIGAPEIVYVGVGYELTNKNVLSFSIGSDPTNINRYKTYTLRHQLFFRNANKFEDFKTWYFSQEINYYYQRTDEIGSLSVDREFKYLFSGIDIGRNFSLSKRVSLAFDLGFAVYLSYSKFENGEKTDQKKPRLGIPTANLQFVYRL